MRRFGREGRFFLFFHTFGVHEYYLNTAEIREEADRFLPGYDGVLRNNNLAYGASMPEDASDLRYLESLYDGALHRTDGALALILQALEEADIQDETLVVLTSDHGEGFAPSLHRTWHRKRLHDDLVRVPLILRWPRRLPWRRSRKRSRR